MKRIHIIGRKNQGKTTLTVALVRELTRRGIRVGTIKHSPHMHELDNEGKDSWRHRKAGGNPAAILTPDTIGIYLNRQADEDSYSRIAALYADCDLVLVEGDQDRDGLKLEIWRAATGKSPIALERDDITALISDDKLEDPISIPIWPLKDTAALADKVLSLIKNEEMDL